MASKHCRQCGHTQVWHDDGGVGHCLMRVNQGIERCYCGVFAK